MADHDNPTLNDGVAAEVVKEASTHSNLPFIITLCALLIYFGFQTASLMTERANLSMVKTSQESALQEAQKIQTQFKTLVTKTSELADKGHAGARMVIEGLQRQGVGSAAPESAAPPPDRQGKK